jgi:hypothetical protein
MAHVVGALRPPPVRASADPDVAWWVAMSRESDTENANSVVILADLQTLEKPLH